MAKKVVIVLASKNDMEYIEGVKEIFDEFGIIYEVMVFAVDRTLDKLMKFSEKAEENGIGVIIACAGISTHLPGVIAAKTQLPVIGVPLPTGDIKGIDALMAIVQMPLGIPVATMAIGRIGVKNAVILSAQILALGDTNIRTKLKKYKKFLM